MDVAPITALSKAPRKIVYVITKSNFGGAQRYVYDLAKAAKAAGNDVTVAAGGEGELFERLEEAGVATHHIASFKRDVAIDAELDAFLDLFSFFRKTRPDIVHLNSSKAGIAALAARLAGVKRILFTVHGWAFNEDRPGWQKSLMAVAYTLTLLLCDVVIAVSETTRKQGAFLPFTGNKFHVVHNGVRPFDLLSRTEARERLLPNSEAPLWIGSIAELHPVKGFPVLIEAFEHFAPDYPDSELVIIGEGEQRPELERQIEVEGVSGRTHLAGYVRSASSHLAAFDIFVLPSRSEALAYVLLEAGSAGLAIVASDVGGIPEIIEDGTTGLLVPYGDREALTNALESLARDPDLRTRLGKALKEKVEKEFSEKLMFERTFALY